MQEQNRNQKKSEGCCGFIIYLSFLIAFWIFTDNPSYYFPCSTSSSTYQWSYITFVSLIIGFALQTLLFPIAVCGIVLKNEVATCFSVFLLFSSRICGVVMGLVCFGGLLYAYNEGEECGDLTTLALVFIYFICVGLAIAVIAILFIIFIGFILFAGMELSENQPIVNENNNRANDIQAYVVFVGGDD